MEEFAININISISLNKLLNILSYEIKKHTNKSVLILKWRFLMDSNH